MDTKESASATANELGARGRPAIAGLEIAESGTWVTLGLAEGPVEINLSEEGFGSRSVYCGRTESELDGHRRLRFVSVLERLGEDAPVSFSSEERPEKPQAILRNTLLAARLGTRSLVPDAETLAVVVPGGLSELQRSLIVKAGESAGWGTTRVVNRTLAVAVGTLARTAVGRHVVLAFDHSVFEAALLDVEAGVPQVRAYVADTSLCGDYVDTLVISRILTATGNLDADALGGLRTFMWLKQRAQQLRQRLAVHEGVRIELPDGVLGDGARAFVFSQRELGAMLADWPAKLGARVKELLGDSEREPLTSVIVAGEFARHPVVLKIVRDAFPTAFVTLADPHAATRGAVTLTDRERPPRATDRERASAVADVAGASRQFVIRADLTRASAATPASTDSGEVGLADGIINRVRELARQGKRPDAETELARLRKYVDALELSLKEPAEALRPDAARSDVQGSTLDAPRPVVDEEKLKRREYLRARDHMIEAEQALKEGRLEQAVALSHLGYKESSDGKIFRAMIKVHLRAARQPPTLQNFPDHRQWLLCALLDDPTNEEVHAAVRSRFLAHAELLASIDTPQAQQEAKKTLAELGRHVEPGDAAAALSQRLGGPKLQREAANES